MLLLISILNIEDVNENTNVWVYARNNYILHNSSLKLNCSLTIKLLQKILLNKIKIYCVICWDCER